MTNTLASPVQGLGFAHHYFIAEYFSHNTYHEISLHDASKPCVTACAKDLWVNHIDNKKHDTWKSNE